MWTRKQVLFTSTADGTIKVVPMRYNASHQRGWRCYLDPAASKPETIREETTPSFHGRSLFDALAAYRQMIEPAGARLLHVASSGNCCADASTFDRFCRRFTMGSERTELIDGFLPIGLDEAVPLDQQRVQYEAWQASLPQVDPNAPALSPGRKALDYTNATIRAAGEAAILARGDLAPGKDGAS